MGGCPSHGTIIGQSVGLRTPVTLEGDLVFGGAGLRGAFALDAQVHPLAHFDPPQRHPAVG